MVMALPEKRECVPDHGCANPSGLALEYCNDVQGADRAYPLGLVSKFFDGGGQWAPMFSHVESDIYASLNRTECFQLRLEVRDGFPSDFILLILQSNNDLGCMLEVLNWGSHLLGFNPQ